MGGISCARIFDVSVRHFHVLKSGRKVEKRGENTRVYG